MSPIMSAFVEAGDYGKLSHRLCAMTGFGNQADGFRIAAIPSAIGGFVDTTRHGYGSAPVCPNSLRSLRIL
jgi:hypothetical protein